MHITYRLFALKDLTQLKKAWNDIVDEGDSFPQEFPFSEDEAHAFFLNQKATAVAIDTDTGEIAGFYILHDNNVGRCSHTANASYGVVKKYQGNHIGRELVNHSLNLARELGYKGIQYNAVVKTNYPAITLYLKLGFEIIGTIPDGYRMKDESFEDILIFYKKL